MAQKLDNQGNEQHSTNHNPETPVNQHIKENLKNFSQAENQQIEERINELDKEWDMERSLQLNAGILALAGTALGILINRRWFALPILVSAFLAQNAIQGWSPPVALLREFGFRTRKEIDREKYGLKVLRGDFKYIRQNVDKVWHAVNQ